MQHITIPARQGYNKTANLIDQDSDISQSQLFLDILDQVPLDQNSK